MRLMLPALSGCCLSGGCVCGRVRMTQRASAWPACPSPSIQFPTRRTVGSRPSSESTEAGGAGCSQLQSPNDAAASSFSSDGDDDAAAPIEGAVVVVMGLLLAFTPLLLLLLPTSAARASTALCTCAHMNVHQSTLSTSPRHAHHEWTPHLESMACTRPATFSNWAADSVRRYTSGASTLCFRSMQYMSAVGECIYTSKTRQNSENTIARTAARGCRCRMGRCPPAARGRPPRRPSPPPGPCRAPGTPAQGG